MIASGEAWAGDSRAVCTTSVTAPRSLAVAARVRTDSWEATSTVAVGRGESGSLQRLRRCRCRFLVEVGQQDRFADPDAAGDRLTDGPGADDDNQLGCCGH